MSKAQTMTSPWPDSTLGRGGGPIVVDGSRGEGGGQVLRTSLALAVMGGRELRIENIRAKRSRPGLLRQHLTAVRAAARISNAELEGDELYASTLSFRPQSIVHGDYRFAVGTAGSTTLVLQTILMPLLVARGKSRVRIEGGTHNDKAPTFDYLERAFFPCMRKMGAKIEAQLLRAGFVPAGGGVIEIELEGGEGLGRLDLNERGAFVEGRARALSSHLPTHVVHRELQTVRKRLGWSRGEAIEPESAGPGNVLSLETHSEEVTEVFTGFGARGITAERVAKSAIRQAKRYLAAPWPVGEYLADQLLLPMALAGGSYRSGPLSLHAETNLALLCEFLDICSEVEPLEVDGHSGVELRIRPA
jgi:RNA 3'-terminal phosphate cyclase (ATP)